MFEPVFLTVFFLKAVSGHAGMLVIMFDLSYFPVIVYSTIWKMDTKSHIKQST